MVSEGDINNATPASPLDSATALPDASPRVGGLSLMGLVLIAAFFVGFGAWAAIAPLASAAIAVGAVSVESSRKSVQHLEGGIVAEIHVRDGSIVAKGAPLVRLDDTRSRANLDILESRLWNAMALAARLAAERDQEDELQLGDELNEHLDEPQVERIVDSQREIFASRQRLLKNRISILEQRIQRLKEQVAGLVSQRRSANEQIRYIAEEIASVRKMVERGHEPRPRLLALMRQRAEIEGNKGEYSALIAKAREELAEIELQIVNLQNDRFNEVLESHDQAWRTLSDLRERVLAARDVVERTVIRAPRGGVVVGLDIHTVGGVVRGGVPLMEIVPVDDNLIVEARLDPNDIDVVRVGQRAEVTLSAYNQRKVEPLDGEVAHISADRYLDERTQIAYYLAKVRLDDEEVARLEEVELHPGMAASVMILTGEATFLDYLLSPIIDSVRKAFREV